MRSSSISQSGDGDRLVLVDIALVEILVESSSEMMRRGAGGRNRCEAEEPGVGTGSDCFLLSLSLDKEDLLKGWLKASFKRLTLVGPIPGQFESSAGLACAIREND